MTRRRRYTRRQRLHTADIAALLAGARPIRRTGFTVLLRANALGRARIGFVVPKRIFPRAVDRNRLKRQLREWFRCHQARLGNRDILVRLTEKTIVVAEIANLLADST